MILATKIAQVKLYGFAVMLLTSLIFLTGATWYFTSNPGFRLEAISRSIPENPIAAGPPAGAADDVQPPAAANTQFAPFLNIVPSQDGTALFISAATAEVGGTVFANVSSGGGNRKGHTLTYSNTIQAYVTTPIAPVVGFTPGFNQEGDLSITTTLSLDTGTVDFNRAYIPPAATPAIDSIDGNLRLTVVSADTFAAEAYVVVVPSFAPPGPLPPGHRLIGSAYSVRASGAIVVADEPMSLRLYYNNANLAGADPHTLAIFAWDANPANPHWDNLGGTLFSAQQHLSVATSRFTTYALMATPTWRDDFWDETGLSAKSNVTANSSTLQLAAGQTSGWAISDPITPTTIFTTWGSLVFTATIPSPTTTLTIDLLGPPDNTPILTNVNSGADLSNLTAASYPALKLRVNMTSTVAGQALALGQWQLSWQAIDEGQKVYLPVVLK